MQNSRFGKTSGIHCTALSISSGSSTAGSRSISNSRRLVPSVSVGSKRSEEPTSELQSLMRISYAVFCLEKNKNHRHARTIDPIVGDLSNNRQVGETHNN